jgi:REP element-mobilizing transposase RayT
MKPDEIPLERGKYYHIYNRGNNHEKLFYKKENYEYFLRKYEYYLSGCVDTYSFCLLPNHFHLLVKVKEELAGEGCTWEGKGSTWEGKGSTFLKGGTFVPKRAPSPDRIISEQFRKFFTGYAMAINKQQKRTGSLFQKNFKRALINDNDYLKNLVFYIHTNPEKHGIVKNFRHYEWSSYNKIIENNEESANSIELLEWFGCRENFINFHDQQSIETIYKELGRA